MGCRGRRVAWWLAAVINLTVLGVSIGITRAAGSSVHMAGPGATARAIMLAGEAMLLPVVTLIVLLVTRRRFDQTGGRQAARKLTAAVTTALGVSCGAFLLLGYLLRDHFSPRPGFGVLARDLPVRFLAGRLPGSRFLPADLPGRLPYLWVFLLFWIVVLAATAGFFTRTRAHRDPEAAGRARGGRGCG